MSHIDEGTLHAYLDGELSAVERADLERHLSVCVPCRNALHEARGFLSESDLLVQALDMPESASHAVATLPVATPRRSFRPATLAWAASILVAIGLGYTIRNAPSPAEENVPPAVATASQPVDRPSAPIQTAPPPAPVARDRGPTERVERRDAAPAKAADRRDVRAYADDAPAPPAAANATADAGVSALAARPATPEPVVAQPRAAQSTAPSTVAMIDGVPVDTSMSRRAFGPADPPAPRRITMDEAVTHLGGTIRLIDGLAPQRVELLAGIDVPGADPSREVVRIYYEEPDLGLVTLDQQRPGPSYDARRMQSQVNPDSVTTSSAPVMPQGAARLGRSAAVASLTWREDGTWMMLTSRLTKDQMASLQARVK